MATIAERYGQWSWFVCPLLPLLVAGLSACGRGAEGEPRGSIHVDGSSTVYPITEALVEEFLAEHPGVQVAVGVSGTGGGFKKFCAGEAEVADASRRLKGAELAGCEASGVDPVEYPIALDGLSILVNPANDFVSCLTVGELREIWKPESVIESWRQVRPEWPDLKISLYGPGIDSGSFDYFTEHIVGEEDASRADYAASEDDNVLVHGVSGDRGALGYFGHAYYVESADMLKLVAVDAGDGCVYPNPETVRSGEYKPLTRQLFLYADRAALRRSEVMSFVRFYFENVARLAGEVGYVPLPAEHYEDLLLDLKAN
ncbi:MAG: PstS family phosphate ABC transporter substrate-binding protein [Gemmatimonadota bacterium]|nr:MAG: PstS family phosphate ABC transporter substrate-binding protein [Gemmatimonadota bacterium]